MPVDFVGREIEVSLGDDATPSAFKLGVREYRVAEQLATWDDRGGQPRRGDRRPQRQRRYYRLRTEDGEVYELYADWSPARRGKKGAQDTRWYLHRRLSSLAEEPEPAPETPPEPETPPASDSPA